jgi:probable HAF family extracellular repeat protein
MRNRWTVWTGAGFPQVGLGLATRVMMLVVHALWVAIVPTAYSAEMPSYIITDLGDWRPNAINNRGQVAGTMSDPSTGYARAALHDGKQLRNLGTLGGTYSEALDINDAGQVVGAASPFGNETRRAFLYDGGTMRDLGTLGGHNSVAYGINSHGHVVGAAQIAGGVREYWGHDAYTRPFLYDGTTMQDLGTVGGQWGYAFGINDAGQVAGRAASLHAFLYDRHGMRRLGYLFSTFQGRAINEAGQLAYQALIFGPSGWLDPETQPVLMGVSTGINNLGHVVGWTRARPPVEGEIEPPRRALLFQSDETLDLNRFVGPSVDWVLEEASAINERGQIAGVGRLNGQPRAFLMTPVVDLRTVLPEAPAELQGIGVPPSLVQLTWNDRSNNETAFVVWRRRGASNWERFATVPPNVRSFSLEQSEGDGEYAYRVRAVNPAGASTWSNEVVAGAPPSAPAGLRVTQAEATRIQLSWTDTSSIEVSFSVWRRFGAHDWQQITILPANTSHYIDGELPHGARYEYRVRAVGRSGASEWSNMVEATTLVPPPSPPDTPAPLALRVASPTQVDLRWADRSDNETGFGIWRRTGASQSWQRIATVPENREQYADRTVQVGATYVYRVRAHNVAGVSGWSNEPEAVVHPALGTPRGLKLVAVWPLGAQITWLDESSSETGFGVWRSKNGGPWVRIGVAGANRSTFSNTNLTPGAHYAYRVRAHNNSGVSAWSETISVVTPLLPQPQQ